MTVNMTDLNIYMYIQYTDKTLILYTSSSVYSVVVAMSMHASNCSKVSMSTQTSSLEQLRPL